MTDYSKCPIGSVLKKRFSCRTLILAVTAIFAAGLLCLSLSDGYAGLEAVLIICMFSGIIEPIAAGYLHHRIDSSIRATIDSFQSLGLRAAVIITGYGFSLFSSRFDIFGGYGFIALTCGMFLACFLLISKEAIE